MNEETLEERFDHRAELCNHDGGFKYCNEFLHEEYEAVDFDIDLIKDFIKEEVKHSQQQLLERLSEDIERIDVSGGGSGRRLKDQVKALIQEEKEALTKKGE